MTLGNRILMVRSAALALLAAFAFVNPSRAIDDHLLLCEAVVTPTTDEFVEIANPTGSLVMLDDYYLSDDEDYALLAGFFGDGPAPSIGSSDFIVRFPAGATIAAGDAAVVAFDGAAFLLTFGFAADYEIAGTDAGTPDMLEAFTGSIGSSAGLTNSGENSVLFTWDGASDLVGDVDMINIGTPSSTNDIGDKSVISVDGPDADTVASTYLFDALTMPQQASDPLFGESTKRLFLESGNETAGGGNGITGDDETTELITTTWDSAFTAPNPGLCNALPITPQFVINEVHADPDATNGDANGDGNVSTTQDEFVELVNVTGAAIDISGWTLADGVSVRHTFPAGTVVPDQCGVVIFSGGTPTGPFGGMMVQTASTGSLGLNNTGDDVTLNDGVIDVVMATYGAEGGNNQSLTLDPDLTGPTLVEHSTATGSGGTLFSPGTRIDSSGFVGCPVPVAGWVINEVLADPDATAGDANGDGTVSTTEDEFVEIVNATGGAVDISGWTVADGFSVRHTFPVGTVVPDQCGVVVFSGGTPTGDFGGMAAQTASTGSLGLNNSGDDVTLNDGVVDIVMVTYGGEGGNDQSITLDPDITGPALVEHSTATGSGGALFSPGTRIDGSAFVGCPAPSTGWVINEILADPDATNGDANGDGTVDTTDDEFVEIINTTGVAVDISSWTLADGFSVRHTFPAGTVVPDQCGVLVFGAGTPTGDFGNMAAQVASTGALGFNNSGDDITLNDGVSDQVMASYGGEGGNNQSLTLDPDITGPVRVEHSTATGSGGELFSPGTRIDGSQFSGCPLIVSAWVINELLADPDATNGDANGDGTVDTTDDEFVELINATGAAVDISGWTLADGFSIRHTFPVGTVVQDQCGIVVFAAGTPTGPFGNMAVQTASTGALGLNNSGDDVTLNDGVMDIAMVIYGGEGGNNQSLTLDPDISGPLLVEHSTATGSGGTLFSPGTRVDGSQFSGCDAIPVTAEIFAIQGNGDSSPLAGTLVTTEDNIVTAVGVDGFFMQTPSVRSDGDVDTSDGIFVFTGGVPTVAVGDQIDVTGDVTEFFGFTEFSAGATITIDSSGNALPPAVVFDAFTPSPDPLAPSCAIEYECYEGMFISMPLGFVGESNQSFGTDPIAEVFVAAGMRPFRETGVEFPGLGLPPIPTWDGNPELFELDTDKLGLPSLIIPAGSTFSAEGGLGFEFGGYELWASQLATVDATLPVAVPAPGSSEFTVGSLNMFRFFDDIDDPAGPNANGEVIRNDTVVSTAEYLVRRNKFVVHILDVLGAPDILAVQEVEKIEVLQDLAADIALVDPTVVYSAHLIEGNDIGTIDVGFMTRDTITVDAVTQFGYTEIFPFDGSLLNDRPPLLLEGRTVAWDSPIAVMVVHSRSLGGISDPSDGDRVRQKRLAQAQFVAQTVQDAQNLDPDVALAVVGDFNAFQFTDGYVDVIGQITGDFDPALSLVSGPDLVSPNLTNQALTLPADERYSFVFNGNAQILDHALTTTGLATRVRGFHYGRGNADAAEILIEDDVDPANLALRASDHDGFALHIAEDNVAAAMTGLAAHSGRCVNHTAGLAVGLPLTETSIDCEAQGLAVAVGDRIRIRLQGIADGSGVVGGAVNRLAPHRLRCDNLTNGDSASLLTSEPLWSCDDLITISVGDQIRMTMLGFVD